LINRRYSSGILGYNYSGERYKVVSLGDSLPLNSERTKFFIPSDMESKEGGVYGSISSE
jgi:hypothetical protein